MRFIGFNHHCNMNKVLAAFAAVFLLQVFWASSAEGARILALFPPPAPSHFFLGNALVKGLVARGHDVTFISSFGSKLNKTNIRDIVLPIDNEKMEEMKSTMLSQLNKNGIALFNDMMKLTYEMTESVFKNTEVQDLLHSDAKFDLVIMEYFLGEAHTVFAHYYNCPLIIASTIGSSMIVNKLVGNQAPPSYVTHPLNPIQGDMNFWQRMGNYLLDNTMELMYTYLHIPNQETMIKRYFPDAPPFWDIIRQRISLILLNSHPSISTAKPMVPNMVEIGGYHISEPKPLPKDLQTYLDNAKEGFILFSMGSNLKSTMLPVEKREALMQTFAQLPYKILWKFEDDQLPGKPNNVRIEKWLPQNDILAHPYLRLFITHGGMLSTTEAIYHGVPVVGIPVFGDQQMNMAAAETLGIGKAVSFKELSTERLLIAVREVLNNKNYAVAAKQRSALFRDQPMRPIDSAMYWIEYVLKHKYVNHLKVNAINLNWFQIQSLDVAAFLLAVVFVINSIFFLIVRRCCRRNQKCAIQEQDTKKKQ